MPAKNSTETRGRKRKDDRLVFNGILWILKTDAPWRDLPSEFGLWKTVHKRFLQWAKLEVWGNILKTLSIHADREAIIIDTSFIKVHQHGCGGKGAPPIVYRTKQRSINRESPCCGGRFRAFPEINATNFYKKA